MMRFVFIFSLFTCLLFSSPLKIASYNVENLFDLHYDGSEYDDYIPQKGRWDSTILDHKLNQIADVICDMNADVVALQEIENTNAFSLLKQRLKAVGCGYEYSAITKDAAVVHVALLSRVEILSWAEITVSGAGSRNILDVQLKTAKEPLRIFVNHWKSKRNHGLESKRMAYAKALASLLYHLDRSNSPYLVIGDFNSNFRAKRDLESAIDDTDGVSALGDVLGVCDGSKPVKIAQRRSGRLLLASLWQELRVDRRWSQKGYSYLGTPDHILIPPALADGKGLDYQQGSFGVFRPKYLLTKRGYVKRYNPHSLEGYSDHLPIYALFDFAPFKAPKSRASFATTTLSKIEKNLQTPLLLTNATLITKYRSHGVLAQGDDRIFLYGSARYLKAHHNYNLLLSSLGEYRGMLEIKELYALEDNGIDKKDYFKHSLEDKLVVSDVVSGVEIEYRFGKFYSNNKELKLYLPRGGLRGLKPKRYLIKRAMVTSLHPVSLRLFSKKDLIAK